MTTESQDDNKGAFRVAQDTPAPLSAANIIKTVKSKQRMLLYTDTLQGEQIGRDDLWAISTGELEQLTPSAPLSADSLRDALRLYRLKYSARMYGVTNAEERERETEICDAEFIEVFNAALQTERQRIADSLPDALMTFSLDTHMIKVENHAGKITDEEAIEKYTKAYDEAVRAVLIPPRGELGGLAEHSETAEPKDTKSITEASALEEER